MVREELPIPSMCNTIPMQVTEAEKGKVVFQAIENENHLNPMGGVHGGFVAGLFLALKSRTPIIIAVFCLRVSV